MTSDWCVCVGGGGGDFGGGGIFCAKFISVTRLGNNRLKILNEHLNIFKILSL